ncbi:unnamed protein product [Ectocarpus sp. 4 AP-2014]
MIVDSAAAVGVVHPSSHLPQPLHPSSSLGKTCGCRGWGSEARGWERRLIVAWTCRGKVGRESRSIACSLLKSAMMTTRLPVRASQQKLKPESVKLSFKPRTLTTHEI